MKKVIQVRVDVERWEELSAASLKENKSLTEYCLGLIELGLKAKLEVPKEPEAKVEPVKEPEKVETTKRVTVTRGVSIVSEVPPATGY